MKRLSNSGLWALIFVWFVAAMGLLAYFAQLKLFEFDHDGRLWQQSNDDNFDVQVLSAVKSEFGVANGTLLHIFDLSCACNRIAEEHVNSVKQLALENHLSIQDINIAQSPHLAGIIPSTPAVILIDESGSLSYLGPYSSGYSCTVGNGLIEPFIQQEHSNRFGAMVVTDSKGCYCPVTRR